MTCLDPLPIVRTIAQLCGGALAAVLLLSCTQGANEPCQIDRDCTSGLVCRRGPGSDRGRCEDANRIVDEPAAGLDASANDPPLPPDPIIEGDAG